jgi:predicted Zn finger-like uncharacterized protein
MFKVECPGCKAPYQVDERRVPASGLKMRCPKCGTSFQVEAPDDSRRTGPSPVLGGSTSEPGLPVPVPRAQNLASRTMVGVAPSALGINPPARTGAAAAAPARTGAAAAAPATAAPPQAPTRPAVPASPKAPPPRPAPAVAAEDPYAGIDLPAVSTAADFDLPAPARPKPPLPPAARAAPAKDLDLPAVPTRPAPKAPAPATIKAPPLPKPAAPTAAPAAPAPKEPALPVARPPVPSSLDVDADLPAVARPAARAPLDFGPDLPSPLGSRSSASQASASGISPSSPALPSDKQGPAAKNPDLEWDLPDLGATREPAKVPAAASASPGFELDLPDLSGSGLPSPVPELPGMISQRGNPSLSSAAAGLPSPSAGLPATLAGLPSLAAGLPTPAAGLPAPAAGLPAPAAGLPSLSRGGAPSVLGDPFDAPGGSLPPQFGAALEAPSRRPEAPGFGELDLELSPPAPAPTAGSGFGDVELPPQVARQPAGAWDDALEADPFGEAPIPSQGERAPAVQAPGPNSAGAVTRAGGGGISYGEVNLDGGGADEVPLEDARRAPREEDMEFGGLPEERGPAPAAGAAAAPLPPAPVVSPTPARRSRWPLRVFGGLLVIAVAGGSLAFVPEVGPYGIYWIGDRVNAAEHERLLSASAADARRSFGLDTWPDAKAGVERLVSARAGAKRMHAFAAYAAFSCYLAELRFGNDPALDARAKVLLDEIGPRQAAYLDLASTARLAVEGKIDAAISRASQITSARPREPEAQVLLAELLLRGKDVKAAEATWTRFATAEPSARSAYGLARAKFAAGDLAGTEAAIGRTLELSPGHVGARILKARLLARTRAGEAAAITLLEGVEKNNGKASPEELVVAETLLGDIHLSRSHVSPAIAAYERALKLSARASRALVGMGQALFQSGRVSEALARFEVASQADPVDLTAQIGIAKSKLALERIEEATKILAALSAKHPQQPQVALWYGRTLEAAGDLDAANAVYHKALESGAPPESLIDIAIALATLQNQRGQADAAQKTLAKARERLPQSVPIYRALGELALAQNRPLDAVRELKRALSIDPEDLPARFQLGIALRRNQKYEEATRAFDAVASVDKDYPGLALERGMIFESTGKTEDALNAYEAALKQAPTDVNLMLRVGCARVAAGRLPEAEEILRKVVSLRPTSAESNHCLGRALLAAEKIPDAERLLDRALELDPGRAQYHLYAGWAANEAGNDAKAERQLAAALAADSSLADAYWQRGILRARQRAGREAVADLLQALKLNPARTEAHAALADAYYDLGREHDALAAWAKAVEAHPENANWRFRYGKLLVTNQMNEAGRPHLEKAIESAEKSPTPPRWLWEAHHFLARALGPKKDAAPHWEQFLRLGPRDSPYRSEAKQALARLGKPWAGE